MRVGLNVSSLLGPLTGIGQYTHHLATHLQAMDDLELKLFYGSAWLDAMPPEAPQRDRALRSIAKHRLFPLSRQVARLYQQIRFDSRARRDIDLYHEPNFLALRFNGPSVVTVHDLSWIRFPNTHPADRVRAMNRYLLPGLQRAQVILTVSSFVKQEVLGEFGLDPAKIVAIPLGVDSAFHPRTPAQTSEVLGRHGLRHGGYVLALGTLEPRKNLATALSAFMQLPAGVREAHPLVLVGPKGWNMAGIEQQLEPLRRAGQVRQLGYLPREELPFVVAGAGALVFPSIYEGFGLPPLEAMASGVPVIASNVSSIPEVVGDAGVLLAPTDVDGFSQAMQDVLDGPSFAAALAEKGIARSRQFTWRQCALDTRAAYGLAVDASRG